ncbi:acyl-CoA thioesterase [Loktanella sp. DJP18]|uniref:acyl-CoA thioesterase n=1 Tax=Loktanella sp. DJP18 TaxID=3409788 RepID=UPI003BB6F1B6
MTAFRHQNSVMFQHCDPAGIVFYPRYFEMMNAVVETFFDTALGWSFRDMHTIDKVGVPTGRIAAEFHAPSRLGDTLDWKLSFSRIGGASADFTLSAVCDAERRLSVTGTLVLVNLAAMTSTQWPEVRRAALQTYHEGTDP